MKAFFAALALLLSTLSSLTTLAEVAPLQGGGGQSRVIDQYIKALEIDPTNNEVRYYLGRSFIQHGNYAQGIEELQRVYLERKNEPEINFNLGYAYLQSGSYDRAYDYFLIVNGLNFETGRKYRLDTAFLSLGNSYQVSGNELRAIDCFNQSLAINPRNIKTYFRLALIFMNKADFVTTLDYLEKARAIDAYDEELIVMTSNIHNQLGVSYLGREMYVEAREEFTKVLEIDSSNLYTIYYIGYLDYLQKDVESAINHLMRLASLKVEDENILNGLKPLLYNIGVYYLNNGDAEKALTIMTRVSELFPEYHKARYSMGMAAMDHEEYDLAIEAFETYLKAEPSDSGATSQLGIAYDKARVFHYEKGKRFFQEKTFKYALKEFDRTLEISPGYGQARKYREAVIAELEKVRKKEEKKLGATVAVLLTEGQNLLREGELLAAKEKINKVRDIDPLNGKGEELYRQCEERIRGEIASNFSEADVFLKKGDYYKAFKSYKKITFLDSENSTANEGIRLASERLSIKTAGFLKEAKSHMVKESFRHAYNSYAEVLEHNPEDERALVGSDMALNKIELYFDEYIGMGRDYVKIEQLPMALSYFNKALTLKQGNETALSEISATRQKMGSLKGINEMMKSADAAYSNGRFNEAISLYSNVLKLDDDNGLAKTGLKNARARRKKKVDSLLTKATALFGEKRYKETVNVCRKILSMEGGEKRAVSLLSKAKTAIADKSDPLVAEGKSAFDKGDMGKAIILFKRVLKADSGNSVARRYLSKMDKAQVSKIVGKKVKSSYLAGLDHYTKGHYKEALNQWNKVLELEPGHEKAQLNIDKAKRKLAAIKGG